MVRALQRAKRLVYDLGAWPDDLDNLPRIEITDVDFNQINLAREEHTNESGYATHKWPLLILNSFEEHYASILREMESQPKTRHPSQHSNRIYSILRRLDNRCREVGIRISSTENSQFYKLAAYVLPGTPDLRYSIRKVIEALNAEGRRG